MEQLISQSEFFVLARQFIEDQTGQPGASIGATDDLLESGVFDSILVVEFFFLLENLAGRDIPSGSITVERISSLAGAYQILTEQFTEAPNT